MIRALIRTLSDSALYIRDSVASSSSGLSTNSNKSGMSLRIGSIASFLSSSLNSNTGRKIDHAKGMPLEIISHIVSYVAESPKAEETLRNLLLVDKRWNACTVMHLWQHKEINAMDHWTAFYEVVSSTQSSHHYGAFIRHLYLHDISVEPTQWITLTNYLSGAQLLSLEKVVIPPCQNVPTEDCYLPTMQCLRDLIISDCSRNIMTGLLVLFQRAPRIQKLSITGSDFNEGDLCTAVTFCSRLQDITVCCENSPSLPLGGDALASALVHSCPKIHSLDLNGLSTLSEVGFMSLLEKFGSHLKRLQLRRLTGLSTMSLLHIARFCTDSKLKRLSLCGLPMLSDRVLELIMTGVSNSLEFLQLDSVPITDRAMRAIARYGNSLKQLRMYDLKGISDISFIDSAETFPVLRQLLLHGSPDLIEASSLKELGAPQLERLELVGCYRINETCMYKMIDHWKHLKRFIYVGSHASEEFQRDLKRRLPNCNTTVYVIPIN